MKIASALIFLILFIYDLTGQCDVAVVSFTNSSWCECSGSASSQPISGAAPYTFTWSNGNLESSIDSLCEGIYYITLTDDTGCSAIDSVEITQPLDLDYTVNINHTSCDSCNDGSIAIVITEGCPPYTIDYYTTIPPFNPINVCSGTYPFRIIDDCGCVVEDTAVVLSLSANNELSGLFKRFEVFPCPINDKINILLSETVNYNAIVSIININGIKIFENEYKNIGNKIEITGFKAMSGVYFLKMLMDSEVAVKKIIVN